MRERLDEVLGTFFRGTMALAEVEGIDRLVELDLSMTQARMLHVLASAGRPLAINELAAELRLSVATAGRTVDQPVEHMFGYSVTGDRLRRTPLPHQLFVSRWCFSS